MPRLWRHSTAQDQLLPPSKLLPATSRKLTHSSSPQQSNAKQQLLAQAPTLQLSKKHSQKCIRSILMPSHTAKAGHCKFRQLHPNQQFLKAEELAAKLHLSYPTKAKPNYSESLQQTVTLLQHSQPPRVTSKTFSGAPTNGLIKIQSCSYLQQHMVKNLFRV